jgi:hypothetical protein
MLKNPNFKPVSDHMMKLYKEWGEDTTSNPEPGVFVINHHNFGNTLDRPKELDCYDTHYPQFENCIFGSYGVCDTPEQFLNKFRDTLESDCRTFCVAFTHVAKDPENAGNGGGWRWHKWGEYIGTGQPTTEYLDDEEKFNDGIYTYHIEQIDGPILKLDYSTGKLHPKATNEI